ncbi:hypothetical protein ANN_11226 [Periplaneta americana]|uniref:Uncharacterized protein n=1 Tax=Periplaneta americana TaxID=6978 RepID=A0ABQ8T4E7_PERAM|nr:hypothetical protein ANN_11226 [Periplaneta americana]
MKLAGSLAKKKLPTEGCTGRNGERKKSSEQKKISDNRLLLVVLYGCETWTLTLSEEQGLRMFENKFLRILFGAKRDEVTGEWRKLHNAELHALYSSLDIIRKIKSRRLRWAGHVARMGEFRNAYRVLVGRPEGKRSLGRPRRRWEDNIKMDLRKVVYDDRDWINLTYDRDQWRPYVRAATISCQIHVSGQELQPLSVSRARITLQRKGLTIRKEGKMTKYGKAAPLLPDPNPLLVKTQFLCSAATPRASHEGPRPASQLLASRPYAAEAEMDDHPARMEVWCGLHDDPPSRYSWFAKPDFRFLSIYFGYADDVNMLGENPQTMEVNPEKTKYMIMSRDENIVRNGNTKIGNLSFEEVEKFKYQRATLTNINYAREEIKHRINMGNVCYYSVEKLLSSSLLSKNLKVRIYKTVILPIVLYDCETWTLTLREELRLRVFQNKVLRKIFGAKRDEVTGEWRKLHNTELHELYSSPDIIRNIKSRHLRWAGHVARMGESRNAYRVLVRSPEGKIPLRRPRRRWEDNIKMDLREVGYDDRDWINLAQDRDQ